MRRVLKVTSLDFGRKLIHVNASLDYAAGDSEELLCVAKCKTTARLALLQLSALQGLLVTPSV
jgi:hypothetical protein